MVEIGIGFPLFLVYQIIPLIVSNFYGEGLYELHGKFCWLKRCLKYSILNPKIKEMKQALATLYYT